MTPQKPHLRRGFRPSPSSTGADTLRASAPGFETSATARGDLRTVFMALLLVAFATTAAGETLLVHLPSAPVEAANRQAEAITTLTEYLAARFPGRDLEAKIFRRWGDAQDYLSEHSAEVTLMLTDASSTLDRSHGLTPAYRFERAGLSTYRRLLVVRTDRPELEKMVDLKGKTLALVETAGAADLAFLKNDVFEDGLDPAEWFSIVPEADDFTATASVLYAQTDAALVAEYNPLLASHLGQDLRTVFESPALSLPVLSVREPAFEPADRETLDRALEGLADDTLGRRVLADLGIQGLRPVAGDALAQESVRRAKTLTIASAAGVTVPLDAPTLPAPELLSFAVAVELPEIPLELGEGNQ